MNTHEVEPLTRVTFTQRLPVEDKIRSDAVFLEIMEGVLRGELQDDYDPSEIHGGADWSAKTGEGWRFRVRSIPFNIDGLMQSNSLNAGKAEELVRAAIHAIRTHLQTQEDNGEWRLLCYELENRLISRKARTPSERAATARKAWSRFSGEEKPPEQEERFVQDKQVKVVCVFVDCAKAPEVDRWAETTGGKGGAFSGASLPRFARTQYRRSREILHRQMGLVQVVDGLTPTQVEMVKEQRERGVGWRTIARQLSKESGSTLSWTDLRKLVEGGE